jgi:hypothetical protein
VCILLTASATSIFAQPKLSSLKSSSSIKADIEKVAADYFENFNNLKGEIILETVSTIQYQSKVIPTGALDATITRYKSPNSYSWQSTLFKTEDFKEAVGKYKQFFRQLDGATITFYDKSRYKISGFYDTPDEGRSFASSTLVIQNSDNLRLFKVEIGLNFAFPEWIVKILVYEKIADEDVRPTKFF